MMSITRPQTAANDLNRLRRGHTYRAVTRAGNITIGEYLGIEVAYDVWCILLRTEVGTDSIPTCDVDYITADLRVA